VLRRASFEWTVLLAEVTGSNKERKPPIGTVTLEAGPSFGFLRGPLIRCFKFRHVPFGLGRKMAANQISGHTIGRKLRRQSPADLYVWAEFVCVIA